MTTNSITTSPSQNEELRITYVKKSAVQDPSFIARNIEKCGITNQIALTEIALLIAKNSPADLCETIDKFGIHDEGTRIEIAKTIAKITGIQISKCIQNFHITDQASLIEIAKIATNQGKGRISTLIRNYHILDQSARVDIALMSARLHGWSTSDSIEEYEIVDEKARIQIAKCAAQQDGLGLSINIGKYHIGDESELVKIAQLAIEENSDASEHMKEFHIKGETDLLTVAWCSIQKTRYPTISLLPKNINIPKCAFDLWEIQRAPVDKVGEINNQYKQIAKEEDPIVKAAHMRILTLCCLILQRFKTPEVLENIFACVRGIEKERNVQVIDEKANCLLQMLVGFEKLRIGEDVLEKHLPLFKELLELKDPELYSSLSKSFLNKLKTTPKLTSYSSKTMRLASLFIEPFIQSVKETFTVTPKKKTSPPQTITFTQRVEELLSNKYFDDILDIKSVLHNLFILIETPLLSDEEKTKILRTLIFAKDENLTVKQQKKQLLFSSQAVVQFIKCNEHQALKAITNRQDLLQGIQSLYRKKFTITVDDFENKFLRTIGSWRKPDALLTYANVIDSLPQQDREKIHNLLKKYALSVLNGTFLSDRYAINSDASEHLLKMHEKTPHLLEAWKKGYHFKGNKGDLDIVDTDDPCDLLLSGTEVGSCQRVNNQNVDQSKCLVAYLLDPKIRMMAIKNKDGVIITRCMLRLLWNPIIQCFVLYQEKMYGIPSYSKKLEEACIKRAEQLNMPLYTKKEGMPGNTILQSFRNTIPYEYVDALASVTGGVATDDGYRLTGCQCLYRPPTTI